MYHIIISNTDCFELMKKLPDCYYDLTIADPPYGIGKDWEKRKVAYDKTSYTNERIKRECFDEIYRVSKKWIIWGYNYYADIIPPTNYLICWNKKVNRNLTLKYSEFELAATSVRIPARSVYIPWDGFCMGEESGKRRIHPHQKPVGLYRWLLDNYASPSPGEHMRIFDPFAGSGSLGIACKEKGFIYYGCEIDPTYYELAIKRIEGTT